MPSLMYLFSMLSPRCSYVLILAAGMVALASCSSTQVMTRWQDPTTTQIRFTKVLALCITKDQSLRDAAEGELCQHMPLVECKPAYLAIPDSMISKVDEAKALTLKEGFDGAVVVRVLDRREQVTYMPPSYGPTFWGTTATPGRSPTTRDITERTRLSWSRPPFLAHARSAPLGRNDGDAQSEIVTRRGR